MNLIKYLCDGVIGVIDDRVRAICEKYESRLNDYVRHDVVGCTLILAGTIAEAMQQHDHKSPWLGREELHPSSPVIVRSAIIAMRFELPTNGWLSKTTSPEAPFKPEYWFLLGPENCFVQKLLLYNVNLSVGEGAGHFGRILGPTIQCQHKITAEVRRGH